ncbi:hypothetical protein JMN32_15410 [Fulvivirga sp. 29W222]|uniref:STAS/SEC14 domain-containing protein n=1 Tax=Fulvivirga marina TaxID=2494733 RepID=A0A937G0F7_9BACT|nr:hypothetical protein [Fulvivirga marina]MBL6447705.1 hypothetical protein [Fulvivirga marina]
MNAEIETPITRLYAISNGTSLNFDPSGPYLIASWLGFAMSEEFRSFLDKSIGLIEEKVKEHGKLGWISDFREGKAVLDEDVQWATENWNSRASEAGLQYNALIIPENLFLGLAANDYKETTEQVEGIVVKRFKDIESARVWLSEVLNN